MIEWIFAAFALGVLVTFLSIWFLTWLIEDKIYEYRVFYRHRGDENKWNYGFITFNFNFKLKSEESISMAENTLRSHFDDYIEDEFQIISFYRLKE